MPPIREESARILLVEDEAVVAIDIQSQLEALGYTVVGTATRSDEAVAKAEDLQPNLVLMDIRLNGSGDGIEAAEQIRHRFATPVVFLTANTDATTISRAKQARPYGYLVKPFDNHDLHTTIEVALFKGRADQALRESHDNLQAVLDVQRQGTIMLDEEGRVTYVSRSAEPWVKQRPPAKGNRLWPEVLGLDDEDQDNLAAMLERPVEERSKVTASVPGSGSAMRRLEIEVLDDPRTPHRKILFLYDVSELHELRRALAGAVGFEKIVGRSEAIERVFQLIHDFAAVESTVLIEGETGTGKELVAGAIHARSRRSEGPYVALNCAGLSEDLSASQLFGHRRGAFTGAVEDQQGLFEAADGGTLFLDEIGDLPMRIQTTLLRVIEERAVMRLGDSVTRPVDVRIVTATNRDLAREAAQGRFRRDLLYRIRVARIELPPLRQRREDIPILVGAFLNEHRHATGKPVEAVNDEALKKLLAYDWPGNVRELKNAVEFAVVRCRESVLGPEDLPPEISTDAVVAEHIEIPHGDDRGRILAALARTGGNRKQAADLLGISRATFYRRLSQYGIGDELA